MPIARVFLDGVKKPLVSAHIVREGERAVDIGNITFTGDVPLNENQKVDYIMDRINTDNLLGIWHFEDSLQDESGNENHGTALPVPTKTISLLDTVGWTKSGTLQNIELGLLKFNATRSTTKHAEVYDFGSALSDTNWVIRFKYTTITPLQGANANPAAIFVGLSSSSSGDSATSQDFIGFKQEISSTLTNVFKALDTDGANLHGATDASSTLAPAKNTDYWIRISRTSTTTYKIEIYRDAFKTLVETINGSCASTTAGLRYLIVAGLDLSTSGADSVLIGHIDTIQVFDAMTMDSIERYVDAKHGKGFIFNGQTTVKIDPTKFNSLERTTTKTFHIYIKTSASDFCIKSKSTIATARGWSISVNSLGRIEYLETSTDVTNQLKVTSTNTVNNGQYRHVIIVDDGSGTAAGIALYIDGLLETNIVLVDNLVGTIVNASDVIIGSYMDGSKKIPSGVILDECRIYDRMLDAVEIQDLYSNKHPTRSCWLCGKIWKVEDQISRKVGYVKSLGKVLGEIEADSLVFSNVYPENIVKYLITKYTTLTYIDSEQNSGILLTRFVVDGKLLDNIINMALGTGRTFRTYGIGLFRFEPLAVVNSGLTFTHGINAFVKAEMSDDTELINDVVLIGENIRYQSQETFSGDGSTKVFTIQNSPVSTRVTISGTEKTPETDYVVDIEKKTITFTVAPASASNNVVIYYEFEKPVYVRSNRPSSISQFGTRSRRIIAPWIRTVEDGLRYVSTLLTNSKDVRSMVDVVVPAVVLTMDENSIASVVNSLIGISGTYLSKSMTWDYPQGQTRMRMGQFAFDDLELHKQVVIKLHNLESSVVTTKDLRGYESAEEVLALTDTINKKALEQATYNLVTTIYSTDDEYAVTLLSKAYYNNVNTTYSRDDKYST